MYKIAQVNIRSTNTQRSARIRVTSPAPIYVTCYVTCAETCEKSEAKPLSITLVLMTSVAVDSCFKCRHTQGLSKGFIL